MERLTEKRDGQNVIPLRQNGKVKWSICSAGLGDAPTEYLYGEHADRLASIEDTLGDEYDLDLVQKLIQAYREGRYIILKEPEQAGVSRLRELAQADREGRCVVMPCKVEDDVYINILGRTLPFTVISISQMSSTPTFKAQHGIRLVYIFKADDVGETVFMTRAEAESALQGEREEKQ